MAKIEPHDLEAEKALLGAMLISKEKRADALDSLREEDFYDNAHQLIFKAMKSLRDQGLPADVTTVTSYLKDHNNLGKMGGVEYLLILSDSVATVLHSDYYIKILQNKSMLRNVIKNASEIISDAYLEADDVPGFLALAESKIMAATKDRTSGDFKEIEEVVREVTTELIELANSDNNVSGVETGFKDLDKITHGFHSGAFIVIAARPAMGKTAFALNIAQHAAYNSEFPVALFSLEMDAGALIKRVICSVGEIKGDDMKSGDIIKKDKHKYYAAAEKTQKCNLHIDDSGGITINDIAAKCRQLKSRHGGIKLIVVDYLQLIIGGSRGGENRQQEVSDISRRLKALARELEVPVIALSQLSRSVESRSDKKPMLSDLRESGAIEQDADMVTFIYREGYYSDPSEQKEDNGLTDIIIAKHRNGPTGSVSLVFQKEFSRFSNLSKIGPDGMSPGVRDIRD